MALNVVLICFPLIFLAELPDKTMFATLVMATKGRPFLVWLGAGGAFAVHVAIATTIGVALFRVLPHRVLDALVAVLFLLGAGYSWWEAEKAGKAGEKEEEKVREGPQHGAVLAAFALIFLAEWGDLTQVLTANLAARYRSPFSVGVGALLALWCVAGIAVVAGQSLLRFVHVALLRRVTAVVLVGLAGYYAWLAAR